MLSKSARNRPQVTRIEVLLVKNISLTPRHPLQRKVNLFEDNTHPMRISSPKIVQKTPQQKQSQLRSQSRVIARPSSPTTPILISRSILPIQRPTSQVNQRPIFQSIKCLKKTESKPTTNPIATEIRKTTQHLISKRHCGICFELLWVRRVYTMTTCQTKFHFDCVKNYILGGAKSLDFSFRCPSDGCNRILKENDISVLLSKTDRILAIRRLKVKDALENPTRLTICSTPDCQHIFSIPTENPVAHAVCPLCKKSTCLFCKVPFHTNLKCEEHKTFKPDDLALFDDFGKKNWKRCLSCLFWIEKNEGCNHMTCKCGNQFCYVCGVKWKTCSC